MIFAELNNKSEHAMKAALEQYIAANRVDATSYDLTRLYATSATIGACADLRAEMLSQVPLRVMVGKQLAPDTHPLYSIFKRGAGYSAMIRRMELSLFFWGQTLLWKDRNAWMVPRSIWWLNPTLYTLDAYTSQGLRGFHIGAMSGREHLPDESYLDREDAVYLHEMDFQHDFDGVSPAERAFLEASTETEKAQTLLATFRNMGLPVGIVQPAPDSSGRDMNPEERDSFSNLLRRVAQGAINAGRTIVARKRYEYLQLQSVLKDMDLSPITNEVRETVAIASRVPLELIKPSAASYASFEGARRVWAHSWLVPRIEWIAQELTEQLASDPFLLRYSPTPVTIEPDLDAVPFLKEDMAQKVTVINARVQGGYLSLYDAQVEAGQQPDERLRDMYVIPGAAAPLPAAEIPTFYKVAYPQLAAPQTLPTAPVLPGSPDGTPPPIPGAAAPVQTDGQTPPVPDAQSADIDEADTSFFVGLNLANNPDLIALQKQIRGLYGDVPINWNAPDSFHVTLIYAPQADDAHAMDALDAVSVIPVPDIEVRLGSLRLFENPGEYAIHFRIRENAALREYQQALHAACVNAGLGLSSYSDPARWLPHVTMGYSPVKVAAYTWNSKLALPAGGVTVNHGDATLWKSGMETVAPPDDVPDGKSAFISDAQYKELTDWRRIVDRKGAAYDFKPAALPPLVAAYIRAGLDDAVAPDVVFGAAREWLSGKSYYGGGGTREQFQNDVRTAIQRARGDQGVRRQFGATMRATANRYGLLTIHDAFEDAGVPLDGLDESTLTLFKAWRAETSDYISGFGSELFKEGGITDAEVDVRVTLWANKSLDDLYFTMLRRAAPALKATWRLGATEEHCGSCAANHGQTKTLDEWGKSGFPRDRRLACGGWKCDCDLFDEQGRRIGAR